MKWHKIKSIEGDNIYWYFLRFQQFVQDNADIIIQNWLFFVLYFNPCYSLSSSSNPSTTQTMSLSMSLFIYYPFDYKKLIHSFCRNCTHKACCFTEVIHLSVLTFHAKESPHMLVFCCWSLCKVKCVSCTRYVSYLLLCLTIALVNMATKLITRFYKLKYLNTYSCYLPNLFEPCTWTKARFPCLFCTLVFEFTFSFISCFLGFWLYIVYTYKLKTS